MKPKRVDDQSLMFFSSWRQVKASAKCCNILKGNLWRLTVVVEEQPVEGRPCARKTWPSGAKV